MQQLKIQQILPIDQLSSLLEALLVDYKDPEILSFTLKSTLPTLIRHFELNDGRIQSLLVHAWNRTLLNPSLSVQMATAEFTEQLASAKLEDSGRKIRIKMLNHIRVIRQDPNHHHNLNRFGQHAIIFAVDGLLK
jgi:hypothetical protein